MYTKICLAFVNVFHADNEAVEPLTLNNGLVSKLVHLVTRSNGSLPFSTLVFGEALGGFVVAVGRFWFLCFVKVEMSATSGTFFS